NEAVLLKLKIYWNDYHTNLEEEELEVRRILQSRMSEVKQQVPVKTISFNKYLIRVAAILVICLSIGLIINELQEKPIPQPEISWVEKVSVPGQRITTILSDGTKVKLNSNSKIIVPSAFIGDTRKVILHGEAFFEVTRDEAKPFIIETENIEVKVLGTSFLVSAYEDTQTNSVAVKTGKVEVKGVNALQPIQLIQFESTEYDGEDKMDKSVIKNPEYVFGWVDQKLLFDNQSIQEVLKQISKWYGVEIVMEKSIGIHKKYTARYDNPTLKEVMDILAFVYDFKYEIKENDLIIK
ncbi:unnamed protein product, partial [Chrysoparadoxa australica]